MSERFPNMGDPSTWGGFDPSDPVNIACETERKMLMAYLVKRLRKPQCRQDALLVAMFMATAQLYSAATGTKVVSEDDRARLHEVLDFALVAGVEAFNSGETVQ